MWEQEVDMKINTLGIVLSYYRRKENLTLDTICGGLCSPVMLERIEQGERIADSLLGELLLERIGKEVEQFELLLNEEDYALWHARKEIQKSLEIQDCELLRAQTAEYRIMPKSHSALHEQFCLYYEAMAMAAEGKNRERICERAQQALYMTSGLGEKRGKNDILYTQTEIKLILLLIENDGLGSIEETEDTLLKLLRYVETFCTERRKEETGVTIISELLKLAQERNDEKKVLEYIDKGISLISQGRGMKGLEKLHFLKAQVLAEQYNGGKTEEKRAIQREWLMAYCICETMGFTEKTKEIERFCEEKLSWQITTLEM